MVTLEVWQDTRFGSADGLDVDAELFHYTTVERAASIALTGRILLSPLQVLNDPRESQVRRIIWSTSWGDENDSEWRDQAAGHEERLRRLRAGVRVACFTADHSKTRGFARPSMWAHYGDAHKGCCLVLDKSELLKAARSTITDPEPRTEKVEYIEGHDPKLSLAEIGSREDYIDSVKRHRLVVDSLFRKNADWESENEFRIVADRWPAGESCAIDVAGAVVGLVFGTEFPQHQLPIVDALRSHFSRLTEADLALLTVSQGGELKACPMVEPKSDSLRRWNDDQLRNYAILFD